MTKLPIFILLLAGTVFARNVKNDLVGLDYIKDLTEQLINERDTIYDPEFDPEVFDRIEVINDMIKTLKKLKKTSSHTRLTWKGKQGSIQQARDSILNSPVDQRNENQGGGQVNQKNINRGGGGVNQINTNRGRDSIINDLIEDLIFMQQDSADLYSDAQINQSNQNQGGGAPVSQSNFNG